MSLCDGGSGSQSEWKWLNILCFFRSTFVAHFLNFLFKTDQTSDCYWLLTYWWENDEQKLQDDFWYLPLCLLSHHHRSQKWIIWLGNELQNDYSYHLEKKLNADDTIETESSLRVEAGDWVSRSRLPGICIWCRRERSQETEQSRKRRVPTMGIQRSELQG